MWGDLWQELGLTLRLAGITTAILVALGIPLAAWLNRRSGRFAVLLEAIVSLPIVLPPTVLGFYLLIFLAPSHFPGSIWRRWFGHPLSFSFEGIVFGSVLYSLPFAVQPFQAALRGVPATVLEAASLEASPWQVFVFVRVPLAARGLLVGATLAFAHTVGEFGVVLLVGGNIPGQTRVASIALYDAVQNLDYGMAHRFALVLLTLSLALLIVTAWMQRNGRFIE
ncbi:MAG: molybdate ABC transporter permease subunit [Verrucomicrobia bacterium]|nr:molybdate ABC transporter permease subunit [Verrucomicrobiota bacterium]